MVENQFEVIIEDNRRILRKKGQDYGGYIIEDDTDLTILAHNLFMDGYYARTEEVKNALEIIHGATAFSIKK